MLAISVIAVSLVAIVLLSAIVGAPLIDSVSAQSIDAKINSDGSVTPSSAPITRTGDVYTLNGNLFGSLTIERNYVIFDGAGYTVNSSSGLAAVIVKPAIPLFSEYVLNVTVKNVVIAQGAGGIWLQSANNSVIANNVISNVGTGISVDIYGTGNLIVGNNVTNISGNGIWVWTSNNTIIANNVTNSGCGIRFSDWSGNMVTGNHIANNSVGMSCWAGNPILPGLVNLIYYNNFINNTRQFLNEAIFKYNSTELLYPALVNVWDNGTMGNYWSDYNGTDADSNGIGDTPHFIDDHYNLNTNDTDNYPLMNPITVVVPLIPTPSPSPSPSAFPTHSPTSSPSPSPKPTASPDIPEFPTLLITLILLVATLSTGLIYRRSRTRLN